MTLTIGRASGLRPTRSSPLAGDTFDIEGTIVGTDLPELRARRQQLIGLLDNPDEEVVPIIWSSDPTYDGFYRVRNVRVRHLGPTTTPRATFNVSVERVGGYANPWFELTTQSVLRTNGHGLTTPSTIVATGPAVATLSNELVDLYPDLSGATKSPDRILSNGYTLRCYRDPTPQALTSVRYSALASSFYMGAATLEVQYSGSSTWHAVVGNQLYDHGAIAAGGAPVSAWRISNGLIRLTSTTNFSSSASGTFEIWDNVAGAWESQSIAWNGAGGIGNIGPRAVIKAPVVLRNSPEQVVVRVQTSYIAETWSIQRGAHFASCHLYDPAVTAAWQLGMSTNTAGSSITGGVRVTSNDANGNRMVFATDKARTADTTNTRVAPTSAAASVNYMVGCELAGSSAGTGNAAADLVDQFIGAVSWRQRMVRQ